MGVNEETKTGNMLLHIPSFKLVLTPTGFDITRIPSMNTAIRRVLDLLYHGIPRPTQPVTDKQVSLNERNRLICACYAAGETLEAIAQEMGISYQRVHQIIRRWC